ncbi:MAG: zinc-dependent alcohol dehydrogenase family protein [Parachlamydiales bacterium]|jgi:NADPH:quinone reductase-like Zn-dependent oxidoreductase
MSRVVRFNKTGGPEVLEIETIDVAEPGQGEVRILVKALGLNRAEAMFRSGKYLEQPQFPSRLGYEAAGIVDAIGEDVKGINRGDTVSIVPPPSQGKYGVYGESAIVPASHVIKHPTSISFVEASALWMQYLTAYGALFNIAKMAKGDYVVIPAASSSVGIASIQLCNSVGAIPIATTRTSKKKQALEKVGAKYVIATEEENLSEKLLEITNNKGARIVFDPVGGKTVLELAKGMAAGGILIEYGALSSDPTPYPLFESLKKGLTMRGYVLFELINQKEQLDKAIHYVLDSLTSGALKPVIAKTFKLDDIVEAHRYLESNEQFGKIVVTV